MGPRRLAGSHALEASSGCGDVGRPPSGSSMQGPFEFVVLSFESLIANKINIDIKNPAN